MNGRLVSSLVSEEGNGSVFDVARAYERCGVSFLVRNELLVNHVLILSVKADKSR